MAQHTRVKRKPLRFFRKILPQVSPLHASVIFRQKEFKEGSIWIQSHMSSIGLSFFPIIHFLGFSPAELSLELLFDPAFSIFLSAKFPDETKSSQQKKSQNKQERGLSCYPRKVLQEDSG